MTLKASQLLINKTLVGLACRWYISRRDEFHPVTPRLHEPPLCLSLSQGCLLYMVFSSHTNLYPVKSSFIISLVETLLLLLLIIALVPPVRVGETRPYHSPCSTSDYFKSKRCGRVKQTETCSSFVYGLFAQANYFALRLDFSGSRASLH